MLKSKFLHDLEINIMAEIPKTSAPEAEDLLDDIIWRTFSLTFVEYPDGDSLGKLLAVLSLSPLIIVIVFLTFFAAKRDVHTMTFGIGTIINGILNYVLKHTIKEARPQHITKRSETKLWEQYGMPSSHSQFMCFVMVYLVLFVHFRVNNSGGRLTKSLWFLFSLSCLGLAGIVAYGRIYLGYHTWSQVQWGSAIGAVFAIIWFLLTQGLFRPWFAWLCSTRLFEFFLIRDYTDIPDVIWFDYYHAKNEAKNRIRKKSFKNKSS